MNAQISFHNWAKLNDRTNQQDFTIEKWVIEKEKMFKYEIEKLIIEISPDSLDSVTALNGLEQSGQSCSKCYLLHDRDNHFNCFFISYSSFTKKAIIANAN